MQGKARRICSMVQAFFAVAVEVLEVLPVSLTSRGTTAASQYIIVIGRCLRLVSRASAVLGRVPRRPRPRDRLLGHSRTAYLPTYCLVHSAVRTYYVVLATCLLCLTADRTAGPTPLANCPPPTMSYGIFGWYC